MAVKYHRLSRLPQLPPLQLQCSTASISSTLANKFLCSLQRSLTTVAPSLGRKATTPCRPPSCIERGSRKRLRKQDNNGNHPQPELSLQSFQISWCSGTSLLLGNHMNPHRKCTDFRQCSQLKITILNLFRICTPPQQCSLELVASRLCNFDFKPDDPRIILSCYFRPYLVESYYNSSLREFLSTTSFGRGIPHNFTALQS